MLAKLFHSISLLMVLFFLSTTLVWSFGTSKVSGTEPTQVENQEGMKSLTLAIRDADSGDIRKVELFSLEHGSLPVANVNGEAITLGTLAQELASMHNSMDGEKNPESRSFESILERLITIKLVTQEALNIGFDRTAGFKQQMEDFALKTKIQQLLTQQVADLQVDVEKVDKIYEQMAIEARTLTYKFSDRADAEGLLEKELAGEKFKDIAEQLVAENKAEGGKDGQVYNKLNELFPDVAKAVFTMEIGSISEIFSADDGFLVFRLEDRRIFEDPETRRIAFQRVFDEESAKTQRDYLSDLIDTYSTFNDNALNSLDFAKFSDDQPGITNAEVFDILREDKTVLVTMSNGVEEITITIANIIEEIEAGLFHGADKELDANGLNNQRIAIMKNKLTRTVGQFEAEKQKVDKTPVYIELIEKQKEQLLFDAFMSKAVIPEIRVIENEAKEYYYNHLEDYSSPLMLKLKSLIFTESGAANEAYQQLRKGSDFQWVSANASALATDDHEGVLTFDKNLLAESSLPHDLQHKVTGAKNGDMFLYSGPSELHYILIVEQAFPSEAKSYLEVRQDVGKIIYGRKINEALNDYVVKLKEAYPTEIYLVRDNLEN